MSRNLAAAFITNYYELELLLAEKFFKTFFISVNYSSGSIKFNAITVILEVCVFLCLFDFFEVMLLMSI